MDITRRVHGIFVLLALITSLLMACAPTAQPAPARPAQGTAGGPATQAAARGQGVEPIKLGILLTHVGGTALFARYEDKGARLLIDQVNRAGGINGRPIELVAYDTEGKPDRAASLYRRLANEDRVAAVIGPDSILVVLGMSSVPSEVKVLSVAAPGNYELIKPEDREYIVSAWGSHGYAMGLILGYFKAELGVKRIGIMTTADAVGEHIDKLIRAQARLLELDVVKTATQPATDKDLLPSLREIAAARPEALMVFGSGPFGNIAINQTALVGLNVPVGYIGGNVVPELIKDVGPDTGRRTYIATGRLAVHDTLPKDDPFYNALQEFVKDYQAFHNEAPALPSGVGYDMALPIIEALKAVGPDRERIKDHVWNQQEFIGMQGVKFKRSRGDAYGTDPIDTVVVTIEGGKFVFKDYLKQSFDKLGLSRDRILAQMKELGIID